MSLINYNGESKVISRICDLLNTMSGVNFEVVQTLPLVDISTSTIYLVPKQTAQTDNIYDEYINTDGTSQGWELIGDTAIDLSDYYTKTESDNRFIKPSDDVDFTGDVDIKINEIDTTQADNGLSATYYGTSIMFRDTNDRPIGWVRMLAYTNGGIAFNFGSANYDISDGTRYENNFRVATNHTNTLTYSMTNPEGFRSASSSACATTLELDANLNNVTEVGFYFALRNNTITNKPTGVAQFGLVVSRTAQSSGYFKQALTTPTGTEYVRYCVNNVWSAWTQI